MLTVCRSELVLRARIKLARPWDVGRGVDYLVAVKQAEVLEGQKGEGSRDSKKTKRFVDSHTETHTV